MIKPHPTVEMPSLWIKLQLAREDDAGYPVIGTLGEQ
jgi:hypothetical protein